MIDGSSAENPMRMTKFAAHAKMSRSHTSTYEGMDDTRSGVYPRDCYRNCTGLFR